VKEDGVHSQVGIHDAFPEVVVVVVVVTRDAPGINDVPLKVGMATCNTLLVGSHDLPVPPSLPVHAPMKVQNPQTPTASSPPANHYSPNFLVLKFYNDSC